MAAGSAEYSATFSGDLTTSILKRLTERSKKSEKTKTSRAKKNRKKIQAKKLLGRKKKKVKQLSTKPEELKNITPASTTAGIEKDITPPPEEVAEEKKQEEQTEAGAVQAIEGRGIFDGLLRSIKNLQLENQSIKKRLAGLLEEKKDQSTALTVINKNQIEDEVIDVEFVVLEQKMLKQADEDVTTDTTGSSAIVKASPTEKKKGPLGGFLGGIQKALGGIFKGMGGLFKNPLALAGAIGGGIFLMDFFSSGAKAADGSVTLGADQVEKLDSMFSQSGAYQTRSAAGSAEVEGMDIDGEISAEDQIGMPQPEQDIAMAQPGQDPAAPLAPGGPVGMNRDLAALAAISALESGSAQGQADVAQSVYNRLGDKGLYGKSIFEVLTRDGQYQPAYKNPNASSGSGTQTSKEFKGIRDEASAVAAMQSYYKKRGINKSREAVTQEFRSAVSNISNPELQAKARTHVGGRTEFLGSGSRLHRLDKPHERWRGGGSDNRFFAAYGSQTQLQRGAVAPPSSLFSSVPGYVPPPSPTGLDTLADRASQAMDPIIQFIPPSVRSTVTSPPVQGLIQGTQRVLENPIDTLKQLRLWGSN